MPERDGYIPGVPCWADTSQPDPDAAVEFYRGLFDWEFEDVMPDDSPGKYYIGRIRGRNAAGVGSQPPESPPQAMWNTYVWVDSADDCAAKVKEAGGTVLMEPFDIMEAGRMAFFADPEGATFACWQAKENKGSQVVNEHGAVNFNNLNTRDVEGAKGFYESVFGWQVLELGGGGMFFTLAGYGDHLETINPPGWREGITEAGAPAEFADVVASIVPLGEGQDEIPIHWNVTFAVDDADAMAARAGELGGEVIMPPMDAPWVRFTVLADPQGATFTASKFVPENKDLGGG